MRANPFLAYRELPRFEALNVEMIEPTVELLLTELGQEFNALKAAIEPTWAGLIEPL